MRIEKVTIKGFLGKKDVCLDFFDSKDPLSSVGTHDVFVIGSLEEMCLKVKRDH